MRALILSLTLVTMSCRAADKLELSATTGSAPFRVQITGPARLTTHGHGQFSKWVGCSYNIDWGDKAAVVLERDCARGLEHTFTTPGTFTIRASTFHPNADDSHSTDWSAEATITVK